MTDKQTDKHNAFYYIDKRHAAGESVSATNVIYSVQLHLDGLQLKTVLYRKVSQQAYFINVCSFLFVR